MKTIIAVFLLLSLCLSVGCSSNTAVGDGTTDADTTVADTTVSDETTDVVTDLPENKFEMREDQVYAADLIKDADTVSVAFIGGSLTECGINTNSMFPGWPNTSRKWVNDVLNYFVTGNVNGSKQIRNVNAVNLALGGTGSDYGSARFLQHLGDFAPDILFFEFSCNDHYWGADNASLYLEYIIRRCLEFDKIPVIVVLHAPVPWEESSDGFALYQAGVAEKNKVAEHYGIKTIDIYDYMKRQHAASGSELSLLDYIGAMGYYFMKDGEYDVHPSNEGYAMFSGAFFETLEADYDGTMAKIKFADVYNTDKKEFVDSRMNYKKLTDESISYEGDWKYYTKESPFITDDYDIDFDEYALESRLAFPDGMYQVVNCPGASFTVTTSASAISLTYLSSIKGLNSTVYLVNSDGSNGEVIGTLNQYSKYDTVNYMSKWFEIPDNGEEQHTVRIVIDDPTEERYVFKMGHIIERFDKK